GRARRLQVRSRPWLEALETRLAPATYTVTTTADEQDGPAFAFGNPGPDGLLSLREALSANFFGDTINFYTGPVDSTHPVSFATPQTLQFNNTVSLGSLSDFSSPGTGRLTITGPTDSNGNNLLTFDGTNSGDETFVFYNNGHFGQDFTFNHINFQNFKTVT